VLGDKAYAEIAPHAARALAGERVRFESRIEYAGAGTRHIEASYIPYREPGGPVLGFVALVTDVGERKRAEAERIRTAERTERLMRITAAIADAVTQEQVYDAVVDQVAHALQASSAGLWVLGADRTARLVRSLHYAPERIARFEQAPLDLEPSFPVLDVMRSGQPIFLSSQAELLARYPHLEPVLAATPQCDYRLGCMPVMVGGRPLAALAFTFDEGPVIDTAGGHFLMVVARYAGQALERLGLLAAEQDSRALAEAGRLRAELLYGLARAVIAASNVEQVFDATLDVIGRALGAERSAILVYDDAGVMRFRAWRGLSPDYRAAVEGHSPWPRDVSAPEPVLVADALGDASLAAYRPLLQRERIGALGFIPLVAGGKLLGKFMVYYDKPRALDPAELALARAIADHVAAALARFTAMQELEQTVRFNELFTGVLGHDLRNPLGAIMTAAQLMLRRGDSERAVKPLSRIMTSGDRMARMIDQLLDLTRVRVGDGIPLDPREGDLGALVHQVVDELDDAHPEWKLRVEVTGATAGSWDVDRLSQVFSNLVANALQHGEVAHGVTVRVDGRAEAQLTVEVLNMGVIPEALLPKLFDPMTGSERRRDRSRGLGLGLFITREILRAHGGSIAVTSSPMAGTCFRVVIPRRQGAR